MDKLPASAAAEYAVQGSERLAAGLDDCEARMELSDWIDQNFTDDDAIRKGKLIARDAGLSPLAYFARAVRLTAGTIEVSTEGVREYVMLVSLPMFYSGKPRADGLRSTDWGSRQIVERYLESALKLRMLSFRLAPFPVDPVALGKLTAAEQRRFLQDLHHYGDSKLLPAPTLTFDGEENGLIWPGIIRFRVDSYTEEFTRFREGVASPNIARFRTFAARELNRCLVPMGFETSVSVYPPLQFADGFTSYRTVKLARVVRSVLRQKPNVKTVLFRSKGALLTLWFSNTDNCFEDAAEFDFTEDEPGAVYGALRYLQKSTGVDLVEVDNLPRIPSEAAGRAY
jgi:hypothetical protein